MSDIREREVKSISGIPLLLILLALTAVGVFVFINVAMTKEMRLIVLVVALPILLIAFSGLYKVEPNQSAVLSLFGKYIGTVRTPGLRFNNPFYTKKKISLRVRNFESGKLKVNELDGSPIEIAAIVVWEVNDSAEAVFNVDSYESFVQIQSEAAIRSMATSYPYDQHEADQISLRSHPVEISERLRTEIQDRLAKAGIHVIEARISHLAYSPEIAGAMLQRQQAGAIIAARKKIVEGAVGMVEDALEALQEKDIVELDPERRAAMVSNLLVVLCSDKATQPVVNTGSIY
ncbi:regulator of protease activity HflC (stomatin/prohibitin superfamily) [Litorimonas taeanensis]|uniref:Regulator of protease activity HflC (Stomatin/prohibitin superfamily) n=1 Tax=Litorimonas taeanensis TaxID=568099 RepID=A0A420WFP0_9PROT|nr:SPFH domain-containing protein [Litorimonas taeanensis]RKQ69801.1 regulator of protease activity HflC (stomatin/prohibitin superfamily) [Litorimonas taeanensis]